MTGIGPFPVNRGRSQIALLGSSNRMVRKSYGSGMRSPLPRFIAFS